MAAAVAAVAGDNQIIFVAAPAQAQAIKLVAVDPPPVFASNVLSNGSVICIAPAAIATAISAPVISTSIETTLVMSNPASDVVASPSTVGAPSRSALQTDSLALRLAMDTGWTKRGAGVAMLSGAANWP